MTLEGVEVSDLGEFKNSIPEFARRNWGKPQEFHCQSGESASVQRMDPAHFECETGLLNFQNRTCSSSVVRPVLQKSLRFRYWLRNLVLWLWGCMDFRYHFRVTNEISRLNQCSVYLVFQSICNVCCNFSSCWPWVCNPQSSSLFWAARGHICT